MENDTGAIISFRFVGSGSGDATPNNAVKSKLILHGGLYGIAEVERLWVRISTVCCYPSP